MQSEVVMREAVNSIQIDVERDPKAHREAIQKLQRDNWNNRWRKVRGAVGVGNGVGVSKGVDEGMTKSVGVGEGTLFFYSFFFFLSLSFFFSFYLGSMHLMFMRVLGR